MLQVLKQQRGPAKTLRSLPAPQPVQWQQPLSLPLSLPCCCFASASVTAFKKPLHLLRWGGSTMKSGGQSLPIDSAPLCPRCAVPNKPGQLSIVHVCTRR